MNVLVLGAGGFIGNHLVTRLVNEGHWVRGVDLKRPEFAETLAHDFMIRDLREFSGVCNAFQLGATPPYNTFDVVYQLAADMGGAGYVFTGDHDADIMHNSSLINLNVLHLCKQFPKAPKLFYSSSACMYPEYNQMDPDNPNCAEDSAYPAAPDSEYGWEKLFSERMYMAFARNYGLDVRIARFHNIFGPYGSWNCGREKAPAAMLRKAAITAKTGEPFEIWGDGTQTRSFLYIDDCLDGIQALMDSDWTEPVNIGSEEMVTIRRLAEIALECTGQQYPESVFKFVPGPLGVRGRNSDNTLAREKLEWSPSISLQDGMMFTYPWIKEQVDDLYR